MTTACASTATIVAPRAQFARVTEIIDHHKRDPARLVPILQEVQAAYRYLPQEIMAYVATALDLPPSKVFGVATFYAHFALVPKGKHVIKLCDGTACHVKDSIPILDALRSRLALSAGKPTTDDMLFTIETVSCLGACGLAPVVVIDEDVHGQMTPQSAVALINSIVAKESQS
jgi:NADH-quinone oxidoreductase subunit E